MDELLKILPFIGVICAAGSLLLNAVKASPEEISRAKALATELVFFLFACSAFAWFTYQCILFAVSSATLVRSEITAFTLSVINVLLYGDLILNHLKHRAGLAKRLERSKLEQEVREVTEQLAEAREKRLAAQMKAEMMKEMVCFAKTLVGESDRNEKPVEVTTQEK